MYDANETTNSNLLSDLKVTKNVQFFPFCFQKSTYLYITDVFPKN